MDATALVAVLEEAVAGARFEPVPSVDVQTTILAPAGRLPETARALRDRLELRFDFLADVTAADYWPREPRFELVYTLVSTVHRHRLRLKARLDGAAAHVGTVSDVWPAANWLEREVWDLFGVVFDGHPDLRRLLMPEDWEGHPLRKDYPVQIRLKPRTAEPLQVTEQEFRSNIARDRAVRPVTSERSGERDR